MRTMFLMSIVLLSNLLSAQNKSFTVSGTYFGYSPETLKKVDVQPVFEKIEITKDAIILYRNLPQGSVAILKKDWIKKKSGENAITYETQLSKQEFIKIEVIFAKNNEKNSIVRSAEYRILNAIAASPEKTVYYKFSF